MKKQIETLSKRIGMDPQWYIKSVQEGGIAVTKLMIPFPRELNGMVMHALMKIQDKIKLEKEALALYNEKLA